MNVVKLSATLAVSQQIVPEHVAAIAEAGYKVLINNRPDGEEANQPPSAAIAAAAEAAGMEYYYMPITAMNFPGDEFPRMCELLANADKPVLAFVAPAPVAPTFGWRVMRMPPAQRPRCALVSWAMILDWSVDWAESTALEVTRRRSRGGRIPDG